MCIFEAPAQLHLIEKFYQINLRSIYFVHLKKKHLAMKNTAQQFLCWGYMPDLNQSNSISIPKVGHKAIAVQEI